jgi:hypothetical protein
MKTISSSTELRKYIEDEIFSVPTEALERMLPEPKSYGPENRQFCVASMWANPLDLSDHIKTISEMELEWRKSPDRAELRPSLIR